MHFLSVQTPGKLQWEIYTYSDNLPWGAQYLQDAGSTMAELLHAEMPMLWLRPPLATYLEDMAQLAHLPVQSESLEVLRTLPDQRLQSRPWPSEGTDIQRRERTTVKTARRHSRHLSSTGSKPEETTGGTQS